MSTVFGRRAAFTTLLAIFGAACGTASGPATGAAGPGLLVFGSSGDIVVLTPDGKTRKQLTKVPGSALANDPTWSPDGKRIVYSYFPPLPTTRGPGGLLPLPSTDLYVMNEDGSDAKPLVPHEAPGVAYQNAKWSPDGKWLYLTYSALIAESNIVKEQKVELARIPAAGGERQTLAQDGMMPAISADGKRLAYVVSQLDGQSLVVSDADGKNAKTILPMGKLDGLAVPHFSPDGKQVAFSAIAPMAPVPFPTMPATVAPTPSKRADGVVTGAERLLATALSIAGLVPRPASAHGLPMDVYMIDFDGSNFRRLTQLGEDSPAAIWSPDGKKMAIMSGGGVYMMNPDGSDIVSIDQKGGHGGVDWKRG